MQQSIRDKLESIQKRYQALEKEQMDGEIMTDHKAFERVGKEMHSLSSIVEDFTLYCQLEDQYQDTEAMLEDDDFAELAKEEIISLQAKMNEIEQSLMVHLLPKDPDDDKDIYLEIRAGAGGDEASLFCIRST